MAATDTIARARSRGRAIAFRPASAWLGVVPFVLFIVAFLLYPAVSIVTQALRDERGQFTLHNLANLRDPFVRSSYAYTIKLSAVSALGGGILGCLLAYAISVGRLPQAIRSLLLSFSGVASNFAGIPLAFAFIATLGNLGLVNALMSNFGVNLRGIGFNLYSFWGLALTYLYFQIPLMVLVMAPTFDGLRREWSEAAESLGASAWQYWRHVGIPVLLPSVLGAMVLLFGNAFGAHATAFALTGGGGGIKVITILIGSQLSGDAKINPGLGNAMAVGMIGVMALTIVPYVVLQRMAERWMQR
jgi:putative spermidine/putrescine transport system permease protein